MAGDNADPNADATVTVELDIVVTGGVFAELDNK